MKNIDYNFILILNDILQYTQCIHSFKGLEVQIKCLIYNLLQIYIFYIILNSLLIHK